MQAPALVQCCIACHTSVGEHVHMERAGQLSAGANFQQNPLRLALPYKAHCRAF